MTCTEKQLESARNWRARNPDKMKAAIRRWRSNNRDKMNETRRKYARENVVRTLFTEAKARAKKRGIEFTISLLDIPPMGEKCPLLGTPFSVRGRNDRRFSPSLDRIDSGLGYVPGNVWIVGYRANLIKNDGTAEEHEKIAAAMRGAIAARINGKPPV